MVEKRSKDAIIGEPVSIELAVLAVMGEPVIEGNIYGFAYGCACATVYGTLTGPIKYYNRRS